MKYVHNTVNSSKFKRGLVIAVGALIALLMAAWLVVNSWYHTNLRPLTSESNVQVVVIEAGSSTSQIAQQLANKPLIRNAVAFSWYVSRLDSDQVIQAGTYSLDSNMSVSEIVDILINGRVDTSLVTILGGLRLDEIRQSLIDAGFSAKDVTEALSKTYDHPLLKYQAPGSTLEGYIYPETYQITASSTPQSIITSALDELYKQLTPSVLSGIKKQGLSVHQAIILASIVEKEVGDPEIQRTVAQVFLSRLAKGMPLGSDVTFYYAAAVTGQEPSPELDSPYNTRIHTGLPPGPIANFNISALLAVADPADTDYLYFVAGDDGKVYFSKTQAEHDANVSKYCKTNCQL